MADVAVDGAHPQARAFYRGRDGAEHRGVQDVGDVVAHPGQCAQVDLDGAQLGDRGEGKVQVQVPQADRGTSPRTPVVTIGQLTHRLGNSPR